MAKLILQFNGIKIKEININKDIITIGRRGNSDITIDNLAVSSKHARLIQEEDKLILEDLGSQRGTFVNEKKVSRCELKKGDHILIGKHTLVFLQENEVSLKTAKTHSVEETFTSDKERQRTLFAKNPEQQVGEEKKERGLKGVISYISEYGDVKEVNLVKKVTVIGKGKDADIKVEGFLIGKAALLINKQSDAFYISRGDGRSSPKLNGEKIKGKMKLRDNDFIEVGSSQMRFSIKDFQPISRASIR